MVDSAEDPDGTDPYGLGRDPETPLSVGGAAIRRFKSRLRDRLTDQGTLGQYGAEHTDA